MWLIFWTVIVPALIWWGASWYCSGNEAKRELDKYRLPMGGAESPREPDK